MTIAITEGLTQFAVIMVLILFVGMMGTPTTIERGELDALYRCLSEPFPDRMNY